MATLDEEQRRLIRESEKGELVVPVKITDSEVSHAHVAMLQTLIMDTSRGRSLFARQCCG